MNDNFVFGTNTSVTPPIIDTDEDNQTLERTTGIVTDNNPEVERKNEEEEEEQEEQEEEIEGNETKPRDVRAFNKSNVSKSAKNPVDGGTKLFQYIANSLVLGQEFDDFMEKKKYQPFNFAKKTIFWFWASLTVDGEGEDKVWRINFERAEDQENGLDRTTIPVLTISQNANVLISAKVLDRNVFGTETASTKVKGEANLLPDNERLVSKSERNFVRRILSFFYNFLTGEVFEYKGSFWISTPAQKKTGKNVEDFLEYDVNYDVLAEYTVKFIDELNSVSTVTKTPQQYALEFEKNKEIAALARIQREKIREHENIIEKITKQKETQEKMIEAQNKTDNLKKNIANERSKMLLHMTNYKNAAERLEGRLTRYFDDVDGGFIYPYQLQLLTNVAVNIIEMAIPYLFMKEKNLAGEDIEFIPDQFFIDDGVSPIVFKKEQKGKASVKISIELRKHLSYGPLSEEYVLIDIAEMSQRKLKLQEPSVFSPVASIHHAVVNTLLRELDRSKTLVLYGSNTNKALFHKFEVPDREVVLENPQYYSWLLVDGISITQSNSKIIDELTINRRIKWKFEQQIATRSSSRSRSRTPAIKCEYCVNNASYKTIDKHPIVKIGTAFCSNTCRNSYIQNASYQ